MQIKLNKDSLKYVVLCALLILSFIKTYSLHANYPFPYHHDEWQHIGLSVNAIKEGYNKQDNPYLGVQRDHADLESGFHLFLSSLFLMTGLDPILNFKYLAAIFSVITAFSLFLCVYRLSKDFFLGLLSILVFISLPSNVNILGTDYFVPLTMAMPFIFMYIMFYVESLAEKDFNKFIFSFFILVLVFLIHPPTFIILLFPAIVELIYHADFLKKSKASSKIMLSLIALIMVIFSVILLWKGNLLETKNYLVYLLVFRKGWGIYEITFFLPLLYGLLNTVFAVIGFLSVYKTKFRFFAFFSFFALAITAVFNIFEFTLFVPYSRAVHYAMLGMIPLTIVGAAKAIDFLEKQFKSKYTRNVLYILAFLLFLVMIRGNNYDLNKEYQYYATPVMNANDYQALMWIKSNWGAGQTIISPYFMTSAVYPVAGSKVISLITAQLEGGDKENNLHFYEYNCTKMKEVTEITKATLIISPVPINCSHFTEAYTGKTKVYKINS